MLLGRKKESIFTLGARQQIIDVRSIIPEPKYELYPFSLIAGHNQLQAVAKMIGLRAVDCDELTYFYPDVKRRYTDYKNGMKAINRASVRSDMIAWIIQHTGSHSGVNEPFVEGIYGIATLHGNQSVLTNDGVVEDYTLAAFWTHGISSTDQLDIARTLFENVPPTVLKAGKKVVAMVDKPKIGTNGEVFFDPCFAFESIGRELVGAKIVDTTPAQCSDGIVSDNTTRLFVPIRQ